MSENITLKTPCQLDDSCPKSNVTTYPPKPCGPTRRRFRSCSVTVNSRLSSRRSDEDNPDNKKNAVAPSRKLSLQVPSSHANYNSNGHRPLKRRHCSFGAGCIGGFSKRRKVHYKEQRADNMIVPPTKFLLGGNITDPLNLNSFVDEKPGSRQQTPDVSPRLPVPKERSQVEVLIPPNINDPLNLNGCDEDAGLESILVTPKSKKRKRKHLKETKKPMGSDGNCAVLVVDSTESEDKSKSEVIHKVGQRMEAVDSKTEIVVDVSNIKVQQSQSKHKRTDYKIVSPVIPQPGSTKSRKRRLTGDNLRTTNSHESDGTSDGQNHCQRGKQLLSNETHCDVNKNQITIGEVKFNPKAARFRYGNYNRYYGYRNPDGVDDYRLKCLKCDWFQGKDVLDIGCNIGHITLSVARDLSPRKIVGIDIDASLVKIARRNVAHYLTTRDTCTTGNDDAKFPISLSICCGPIAMAAVGSLLKDDQHPTFPNNVCFVEGNYVLESDELLDVQRPEFDTIVCLSLTKWVHLNWGDEGVKRLFKRIFRQLRPHGRLILETQAFASYGKKKKLTEMIFENYQKIKFIPEQFTEYLLSNEVGFSKCEVIDTPFNISKGFRRPIQLFTKLGNTHNQLSPSTSSSSSAMKVTES